MRKLKYIVLAMILLLILPIISYEKRTKEEKFVDLSVYVHKIHVRDAEKYFMESISNGFLSNSERINLLIKLKNIELYSDELIDMIWIHDDVEVSEKITWEDYYGKFDYLPDLRDLAYLLTYKSHTEVEKILKKHGYNVEIEPYTPRAIPFSN